MVLGLIIFTHGANAAPVPVATKVHASIERRLAESKDGTVRAWVFFADKGFATANAEAAAVRQLDTSYDSRALTRRLHRRTDPGLTDARDLPVAQAYIDAVAGTGAKVRHPSRWLNAVSVVATRAQLDQIAGLAFVTKVQAVRAGKRVEPEALVEGGPAATGGSVLAGVPFYGESEEQIMQINLDQLHANGFTGDGIVVGVLDTGFLRIHEAFNEPGHPVQIVAEYDFINDDTNTSNEGGDPGSQHNHGTYILGTLGAYKPGVLVGAAYDASFVLCKTEDVSSETPVEEDNYVAGLEFIEMNGGDMATASLSYSDWYTAADYDGMTAVTTIAVNTATANGMYCLNSAANGGHDANPTTATIGAPADALQVLSVGAVDDMGVIAGFSSDGPTADGRVKPEILARGVNTRTVSASNPTGYIGVGGTSLSCPIAAGAVACLIEAHPTWTVQQMRTYLMMTASDYVLNGTHDPLYVRGFGIIDVAAATLQDCDDNGINDLTDIANMTHPDCNGNSIPDFCDIETGHSADANSTLIPDECDAPVNDACANAMTPIACQNMTPIGQFGRCTPSGLSGSPEFCDTTIGTAPQHDCMLPGATCQPDFDQGPTFRCAFAVDNINATTDGPNTTGTPCAGSGTDSFGADVWYKFIAPMDGSIDIHNCSNSGFDSMVQVFSNHTPTCPSCPILDNALSESCNDEGCTAAPGGSSLGVGVLEDACYLIRVGGRDLPGGPVEHAQGMGTLSIQIKDNIIVDPAPIAPPAPHNRPKNRYISFAPFPSLNSWAYRVRKLANPANTGRCTVTGNICTGAGQGNCAAGQVCVSPYPAGNPGGDCWVQTPQQTANPIPAQNTQFEAVCGPTPVFRVWTEPVVHVHGCPIIPTSQYEIYVNGPGPIEIPIPFTTQTVPTPSLNSKLGGDIVGVNNGVEWTAANGFASVNDALAMLAIIAGNAVRPTHDTANVRGSSAADGGCLNSVVSTSDLQMIILSISGASYGPPSTTQPVDPAACGPCPGI